MKKRLQVFVSSTYQDLKPERQAAVEAILRAGHIPAGMELFAAGDVSQMEIIKRWIDESDVYMLILGGRYGTTEPQSGRSYVALEYEYAVQKGIPFFAVVVSDQGLEHRRVGPDAATHFERDHLQEYYAFRKSVLTKISRFFDEPKDIKLAVHETLGEFIQTRQFIGWVSGAEVAEPKPLIDEIARLSGTNQGLLSDLEAARRELATLKKRSGSSARSHEELLDTFANTSVVVPSNVTGGDPIESTLINVFSWLGDALAVGVTNAKMADAKESFAFYTVAPKLMVFGLMEKDRVPASVMWQRVHLTEAGKSLLATVRIKEAEQVKSKILSAVAPAVPGGTGTAGPADRTQAASTAAKSAVKLPPPRRGARKKRGPA